MKALWISVFVFYCALNINAYVYDNRGEEIIGNDFSGLTETGTIKARINGKEILISRYVSDEKADVIKERIVKGNVLSGKAGTDASFYGLVLGALFPRGCEQGYEVFFMEKENDIHITAVAETENGCAAVTAVIPDFKIIKDSYFYNDKICHPKGIARIASIELLSGNTTVNYFNLYEAKSESAKSIIEAYKSGLKKDKWDVTDISAKKGEVSIIAQKDSRQVYISADIDADTGRYMVFVLG